MKLELSLHLSLSLGCSAYEQTLHPKLVFFTRTGVSEIPPDVIRSGFLAGFSLRFLILTHEGERLGENLKNSVTQLLEVEIQPLVYSKSKLPNAKAASFKKGQFPTNPFHYVQRGLCTAIPPTPRKGLLGLFSFKKPSLTHRVSLRSKPFRIRKRGKKHVCFHLKLSKLAFSN